MGCLLLASLLAIAGAQPTPVPDPGRSPIPLVQDFVAEITVLTWNNAMGPPKHPTRGWSKIYADTARGRYLTASDPDKNYYEFRPDVRGSLNWQVQDWDGNGTVGCVGPYHEGYDDKGAFAPQVKIPETAVDHGMARTLGRDNATAVSARRFSWNQTNVPEGCAFEGVDLYLLPLEGNASLWAPLYMVNTDTGCEWRSDTIKTYWTSVAPLSDADRALLAMPAGCAAVAPPCPKCNVDCTKCTYPTAPAACEVDDPDHPEAATCPCRSVATCSEWAPGFLA